MIENTDVAYNIIISCDPVGVMELRQTCKLFYEMSNDKHLIKEYPHAKNIHPEISPNYSIWERITISYIIDTVPTDIKKFYIKANSNEFKLLVRSAFQQGKWEFINQLQWQINDENYYEVLKEVAYGAGFNSSDEIVDYAIKFWKNRCNECEIFPNKMLEGVLKSGNNEKLLSFFNAPSSIAGKVVDAYYNTAFSMANEEQRKIIINNCDSDAIEFLMFAIINEKREKDPLYLPFLEGIDINDKYWILYSCRQRIEYLNANLGRYDDWY